MPSKSAAQARLMRAVAHGWRPSRFKGPPVSVAKEFVAADQSKAARGRSNSRSRTMNKIARRRGRQLKRQSGY